MVFCIPCAVRPSVSLKTDCTPHIRVTVIEKCKYYFEKL